MRFDEILTTITDLRTLQWASLVGLASMAVALIVLTRTRWGQAHPLRKCVILSILAHVLLAGYSTTVQIAAETPRPREAFVRVAHLDEVTTGDDPAGTSPEN